MAAVWLATVGVELLLVGAVVGHMVPMYLHADSEHLQERLLALDHGEEAAGMIRKWAVNVLVVLIPIFGENTSLVVILCMIFQNGSFQCFTCTSSSWCSLSR